MKLDRKFLGTRVMFVLTAVLCFFVTLIVVSWKPGLHESIGPIFDTLQWLITAIGLAILGDTVRPSGIAKSAFSILQAKPTGEADGGT